MSRRPGGSLAVAAMVVALIWPAGLGSSSATGFSPRGPLLVSSAGSRPLFAGPPLAPGEARTRCVVVTNRGAPAGDIRLYGRGRSAALDRSLHVVVAEGFGSCAGFRPNRVLFSGSLASFPRDAAHGITAAEFGLWPDASESTAEAPAAEPMAETEVGALGNEAESTQPGAEASV